MGRVISHNPSKRGLHKQIKQTGRRLVYSLKNKKASGQARKYSPLKLGCRRGNVAKWVKVRHRTVTSRWAKNIEKQIKLKASTLEVNLRLECSWNCNLNRVVENAETQTGGKKSSEVHRHRNCDLEYRNGLVVGAELCMRKEVYGPAHGSGVLVTVPFIVHPITGLSPGIT